MKLPSKLHTLALALAGVGSPMLVCGQAAPPVAADAVVMKVAGLSLTKAEYEKLVIGFERAAGAPTTGPGPQSEQSAKEVARLLAMVEEAKARKLDQDPKIAALMRVRGYTILANALLADFVAEARKDEAGTRAMWASEKSQYVDVQVRQILVKHQGAKTDKPEAKPSARTEAQARALAQTLHRRLIGGADFAALAKTSSEDDSTRAKGGEMPAFTRGAMVAEFEQAAFETPVGGISAPFKTAFGWHILQVVERKPFAFERVRSNLEFARARQKIEQIASAAVQLETAYFKP